MRRFLLILAAFMLMVTYAAAEDIHSECQLRSAKAEIQEVFSLEYTDAVLLDAEWMPSESGTIIVMFEKQDFIGIVIYEQQIDQTFKMAAYNDSLFRCKEGATCLFDGWPGDDPDIWYEVPDEMYFIRLDKAENGSWFVRHMAYDRANHAIQYSLSEDAQSIIVSDLTYPRVWWPIEEDLTLCEFNVAMVCDMCDRAVAYMLDEEMYKNNSYEYRVEWGITQENE